MKIALVHDYLGEFGGAERVLLALSEIWPKAPIYTAFYRKGPAWERFKNKDIRVSWAHYIPGFSTKLHSPLRFLAPLIWGSFKFSDYDVVITSAGWYVTKGVVGGEGRGQKTEDGEKKAEGRRRTIEVCYCHTPPRWLYGYPTSVEWQRYWPVRVYGHLVGHFMRMYDYNAAQRVDYFIANSENVRRRIKKFYRRDATVIYPPVELDVTASEARQSRDCFVDLGSPRNDSSRDYYLVVARIVGGKGLEMAVQAAKKLGVQLKVVGAPAGYATVYKNIQKNAGKNVQFLGYVEDSELVELYSGAKAFLALAQDEDFGITPVEAMAAGTPVVAYRGGGYIESVVDGKTGVFFNDYTTKALADAIKRFEKIKIKPEDCKKQAKKFSKERFKREIKSFVESRLK